jgi:ribosomal protein S18 acetylase RimI-like enzyme
VSETPAARPFLRRATAGDAAALAALAERTFRETFGPANTAGDMDLHCRESYSASIQSREISDPAWLTLLVQDAGTLVGFAQLRWGAAPGCVAGRRPGEIQRLYVTREWQGRGVAHELMSAALAAMRERGCDVVWLGVWERNPRAIAFYGKFGFREVGDHVFRLGTDLQRDLVMVRPSSDRGAS